MKKRLLSSLLSLCMVLTLLPGTAWAAVTPKIAASVEIGGKTLQFQLGTGKFSDPYYMQLDGAEVIEGLKTPGLAYKITLDDSGLTTNDYTFTTGSYALLTMDDYSSMVNGTTPPTLSNPLPYDSSPVISGTLQDSNAVSGATWVFVLTYAKSATDTDEVLTEYYAATLDFEGYNAGMTGGPYSITPAGPTMGGTVTVNSAGVDNPSSNMAEPGEPVTLTATPEMGYFLSSLTVADSNGAAVPTQNPVENVYTFTMPPSHVTYTAVFQPVSNYTVTVTYNAGGGVKYGFGGWFDIASGGTFKVPASGSIPSVGAIPNPGYAIGSIVVNGENLTSQLEYDPDGNCQAVRFPVAADTTVAVTFVGSAPVNPGSSNNSDNSNDTGSSDDNTSDDVDDAPSSTVAEPSTSGGNTTVEVVAASTTSGTTSRAEVKVADMNKAVNSAVAEAVKQGTAPVVEIEVQTSYSADRLEVKLPVSSLEKLAGAMDSSLVITSSVAEVALDHTALSALVNQATGNTITLEVAPVESYSLNLNQQEAVGAAPVVELSLVSGMTIIHNYNDGVITVSLPYTLTFGQSASDIVVYYLEGNGTLVPCNTSYADGKVTFTTTHLSKYVIGDKRLVAQSQKSAFTDVPASAYYADAVAWAVENGIAYGITDTTFGPDVACTRAQIVSFLWRQAGSPKMDGANPFTDVSATDYYYDAVLWAVANGIAYGSTDTTFSPNATCTRAQAMTFLYRDKNSPAVSGTNSFTDVPANEYYADAVQWAVSNGVAYGTADATFSPDQDCTRAQIMSFLYRAK